MAAQQVPNTAYQEVLRAMKRLPECAAGGVGLGTSKLAHEAGREKHVDPALRWLMAAGLVRLVSQNPKKYALLVRGALASRATVR